MTVKSDIAKLTHALYEVFTSSGSQTAFRYVNSDGPITVWTEKTRPSDTNAYIAGDCISESASAGTVWTFSTVTSVDGGNGAVVGARLLSDNTSWTSKRVELLLYTNSITAINDNAEATTLYADAATYLGKIVFNATALPSTNATAVEAHANDSALYIPFDLAAGSQALYGILRVIDAFTPAGSQKFSIALRIRR